MDRRMMDAGRLNCQGNPLWGSISISAEDALAIVDGDLDETLLEDLLFGLCWVDFRSMGSLGNELRDRWRVPLKPRIVPRSWSLLKLLFLPGGVPVGEREIEVRPEPSIVALLHAGRLGDACRVASRRLYAAGLAPVESRFPDDADAARMTAALLVPIRDTRKIVKQVLHINSESLQKG
jgi:CRISPR-associated protein Csx17